MIPSYEAEVAGFTGLALGGWARGFSLRTSRSAWEPDLPSRVSPGKKGGIPELLHGSLVRVSSPGLGSPSGTGGAPCVSRSPQPSYRLWSTQPSTVADFRHLATDSIRGFISRPRSSTRFSVLAVFPSRSSLAVAWSSWLVVPVLAFAFAFAPP